MKTFLLSFAIVFLGCMALFGAHHAAFRLRSEPPRVNVRWSETTTEPMRATLEIKYRLADPRHNSGRTWSYELVDAGTDNIRRLVQDAAVEDTHYINRTTFELIDGRPWPLRPEWFVVWSSLMGIALAMLVTWMGPNGMRRLRNGVALAVAATYDGAQSFVTNAMPDLSARALGLFRIFWAALLFLTLSTSHMTLQAGNIPGDGALGWAWLDWLASHPEIVELLRRATLISLIPFAIGIFARAAYLFAASGMAIWILVWIESQHSNAHNWLVMFLMILCLAGVPWGESALSLGETLRRRDLGRAAGTNHLHSKAYGFAVWLPGFILGSVWGSAAFAKLESSGLEWIYGGAVKYHWVIDAPHAPVEWGLWIATHHWAAVIMSFCGVFFEAVFILSVFVRSYRWRLVFTSTGLALLIGFYLFQGVFWLPWWLVFVSFAVPWAALSNLLDSRVVTPVDAGGRRTRNISQISPGLPLQPVHMIVIILLSLLALFRLPAGFGRFTAYSNTYASTAAFDESDALDPEDRIWLGYGTSAALEVHADGAKQAILTLIQHEALSSEHVEQLRHLDATLDQPLEHKQLTLTRSRPRFDWDNGRFSPGEPVVVGTIDLESLRVVTR